MDMDFQIWLLHTTVTGKWIHIPNPIPMDSRHTLHL